MAATSPRSLGRSPGRSPSSGNRPPLTLAWLAALPSDSWGNLNPTASASADDLASSGTPWHEAVLSEDPFVSMVGVESVGSISSRLQTLDEEELYARILAVEQTMAARAKAHSDAEATLRAELGKLSTEIAAVQMEGRMIREEFEDLENVKGMNTVRHGEADQLRKQLASLRRGAQATRFFQQQAEKRNENMQAASIERATLEAEGESRKLEWQKAMKVVDSIAAKLEKMQAEKVKLTIANKTSARSREADLREYRRLVDEERSLSKQLKDCRSAVELQRLYEEEKREREENESGKLIEQIAQLEESTDVIERRMQERIEVLRRALESGAVQERDLLRTKDQAEAWLQSIWSTLSQQKREQLALHQQTEGEDLVAAQLQNKTDTLVKELTVLEEDVKQVYDEWGEPLPEETQLEEELLEELASIRQKHRAVQHKLAWCISQRKPLQLALRRERAERTQLLADLKPIHDLISKAK